MTTAPSAPPATTRLPSGVKAADRAGAATAEARGGHSLPDPQTHGAVIDREGRPAALGVEGPPQTRPPRRGRRRAGGTRRWPGAGPARPGASSLTSWPSVASSSASSGSRGELRPATSAASWRDRATSRWSAASLRCTSAKIGDRGDARPGRPPGRRSRSAPGAGRAARSRSARSRLASRNSRSSGVELGGVALLPGGQAGAAVERALVAPGRRPSRRRPRSGGGAGAGASRSLVDPAAQLRPAADERLVGDLDGGLPVAVVAAGGEEARRRPALDHAARRRPPPRGSAPSSRGRRGGGCPRCPRRAG